MIISIHQPNFMPWYPFFQKIINSDIFVILTYCQFEKNNYQNRFNMENKWYTMSTYKGLEFIIEKKYVNPDKDWNKIKFNLQDYKLGVFDDCICESLAQTNIAIIKKISNFLNIKTKIVEDYDTHLTGEERLVDICKTHNATTYLSGISGSNYMDFKEFEKNNIEIKFQNEKQMVKKPILKILKELNYV
jgi:hypothetical protein